MANDPTRQVPPPGYPPQPFSGPGYPPQQVPPGYPPQQPPGFPPGYAPQQFPPPGYMPQAAPAYSVYTAQQGASPGGSSWANLGLPGQGALLSAVALLIFFFLPWLSTPDFNNTQAFTNNFIPLTTYSGFSTASGISINAGRGIPFLNFNLFASLWVVPVGAIGLIIIVWLLSQSRITVKAASATLLVISVAILLVTLTFLVEVNSIEGVITTLFFSSNVAHYGTLVGVSFGFWLGVVAAAVALGASAYGVFQRNQAPTGVYH